jgi:DNA-binding beta-propeller fold protein YncE
MTRILNRLAASAALCIAATASAQWVQETVTVGANPGGAMAFSSTTGRAYIPLMGEAAIAVLDGSLAASKIALPAKAAALTIDQAARRIAAISLFSNQLHLIDEASGSVRTVPVGVMPSAVRANEITGRVYVANWGGLESRGSVSVVDPGSMQVVTTAINGSTVELELDAQRGHAYVTFERPYGGQGYIGIVEASGAVAGELALGRRPYALHVDAASRRVFVATTGTLHVLEAGSLRVLKEVTFEAQTAYPSRIAFDATAGRVYFGSGASNRLHSVDTDGNDLRTWDLALGSYEYYGTRANTVHGIEVHAPSGNVYVSSPGGNQLAVFDPVTARLDRIALPGAVGFNTVAFSPDDQRLIVADAAGDNEVTVLKRAAPATNGIARDLLKTPVVRREPGR